MFGGNRKTLTYNCSCCGKTYSGSPSIAYARPAYYFEVPEDQRESRIKVDEDLCFIEADPGDPDSQDIFAIRCTLDVPIQDIEEPFCWGLWVSQSRESFERYISTFNDDQSGDSSFGWLAVTMPYYRRHERGEPTESLQCDVEWGSKGQRPKIILRPCDHPLYYDQINGIDWEKAVEIAQSQMKTLHGRS